MGTVQDPEEYVSVVGTSRFSGKLPWLSVPTLIIGVLSVSIYWCRWYGGYEAFAVDRDRRWGFLGADAVAPMSSVVAPVWLGEFGTDTNDAWWRHVVRYL